MEFHKTSIPFPSFGTFHAVPVLQPWNNIRSARILCAVFVYANYVSGNEIAQFSITQFKLM